MVCKDLYMLSKLSEALTLGLDRFSDLKFGLSYIHNIFDHSELICSQLYKVIMYPNNRFTEIWLNDAISWIASFMNTRIKSDRKPIYLFFSFILDKNQRSFPLGYCSEALYCHTYKLSFRYGKVVNIGLSYVQLKITELYELLVKSQNQNYIQIYKAIYEWYYSINNSVNLICEPIIFKS